jgi:hypothetical protein
VFPGFFNNGLFFARCQHSLAPVGSFRPAGYTRGRYRPGGRCSAWSVGAANVCTR